MFRTWADTIQSDGCSLWPILLRKIQDVGEGNEIPRSPVERKGRCSWTDNRKISHKKALEKANEEYKKYVNQNLSPVEEAYLQTIKQIEKTAKKESN